MKLNTFAIQLSRIENISKFIPTSNFELRPGAPALVKELV